MSQPASGQFLSVDPALSVTDQPYDYANANPINESDPTGLGCGVLAVICNTVTQTWNDTGGKVVSGVSQHWRTIAQVGTVVASGLASAACVAATDGLCALALPEIGGLTNAAVYSEGGGQHTSGGYFSAFATGGISGSLALLCVAGACEVAGGLVVGGALVNGVAGAGESIWSYANSGSCQQTVGGYLSGGAKGFAQGAVPWEEVWKAIHRDS